MPSKTERIAGSRIVAAVLVGAFLAALPAGAEPAPATGPARTRGLDDYAKEAFKKCYGKLGELLDRQDRHEKLPESTWWAWVEDKKSNLAARKELIDEVLEVLGVSGLSALAAEHAELAEGIESARKQIARHQRDKLVAPAERPWWSLGKSRADHQEAIDAQRKRIESLQARQGEIVAEMRKQFEAIGVPLTDERVEFLLASVSGGDALELTSAFHNIKQINEQLVKLMAETDEDPDTARRYYGLHVILVEVLIDAHKVCAHAIEDDYVPRLEKIIADNGAVRQKTRQLLAKSGVKARPALQANLAAQDVTERAAKLYVRHLRDQRAKLLQTAATLAKDHAVATNTYETATVAGKLSDLIEASEQKLMALQKLQLPELVPFRNTQLRRKFEELTLKIKRR